ncbi:hypothetical protein [Guyparkeria sp. TX1]|uniref:hypothetical protein n=1 Tax=Guyparkeria sp. TX1 TaxID=3115001 RepID=UPI0039776FEA
MRAFFLPVMLCVSPSLLASDWMYEEKRDAFNDEDRSFVWPTEANIERNQPDVILAAECNGDDLYVFLVHGYLGGNQDDNVKVDLRVDKNSAYGPSYWVLSTTNKGSFMPMSDVDSYLEELKAGDSLAIRVTDPMDGGVSSGKLSLSGFSESVEKLACY